MILDIEYVASVSATDEGGMALESGDMQDGDDIDSEPFVRGAEKVGRNSACPCGSGKKYKQCHGKLN